MEQTDYEAFERLLTRTQEAYGREDSPALRAIATPEMASYFADAQSIRVAVRPTAFSKYRVQFIGKGGRVLAESLEPAASYAFKGNEGYVRVRVIESNGAMAWAQPVPVPAR